MTEPQAPPKEKAAKKESRYVVLRQEPGPPGVWVALDGTHVGPAERAIKAAAKTGSGSEGEVYKEGSYLAIPVRSFKPVKLATETETRVTLS